MPKWGGAAPWVSGFLEMRWGTPAKIGNKPW